MHAKARKSILLRLRYKKYLREKNERKFIQQHAVNQLQNVYNGKLDISMRIMVISDSTTVTACAENLESLFIP